MLRVYVILIILSLLAGIGYGAYYYYNDPEMAWLVLSINDIVDPYTQWPKDQRSLDNYIIKQYEEHAKRIGLGPGALVRLPAGTRKDPFSSISVSPSFISPPS